MSELERSITVALNAWKQALGRVDKILSSTSDADLEKEVAPGRNRISYLVGHLAAVHDRMLPLLGLGERLHPEMDKPFLESPDSHAPMELDAAGIRKAWTEINTKLNAAMEALKPEQWLERHTAVSEEDFAKEPLRNRLAVLMTRTYHVASHTGQINLAK